MSGYQHVLMDAQQYYKNSISQIKKLQLSDNILDISNSSQ